MPFDFKRFKTATNVEVILFDSWLIKRNFIISFQIPYVIQSPMGNNTKLFHDESGRMLKERVFEDFQFPVPEFTRSDCVKQKLSVSIADFRPKFEPETSQI
jgi:hypothetical protein